MFTVLALLFCSCGDTRISERSDTEPSVMTIDGDAWQTRIPFDLWFNLVFVPGTVNGKDSCWFILDTGFEYSLVNRDRLDSTVLQSARTHIEAQPGGDIEVTLVDGLTITAGAVTMAYDSVHAIPLGSLEPIAGRRIDGIIGHDFFERFVVAIDYTLRELSIIEPAKFEYPGSGEVIPVVVENNEPFMFAEVQLPDGSFKRAKLKLDTGSSDFIGFNGSYVQAVKLVTDTQPKIPVLGTAVGGHTENWVTRIGAFRLNDVVIPNPVIGYSVDTLRGGDAGTIGGEFFKRFTPIFDYPHSRIIFEKNARFDDPIEYDMTGIFPYAEPPDFATKRVLTVTPGSPAEKVGIAAGDQLLSINGIEAGRIGIGYLHRAFRQDGQSLELILKREDSTFAHILHLERMI